MAAFWLGALLYVNIVVIPVIQKELSGDMNQLNKFVLALNAHGSKVILPVALLTIGFGLVRGIVFGPITSVDALLGTTYGHYFLVGLVGATCLLAWGMLVVGAAAKKLTTFPPEEVAKGGEVAEAHKAALDKLKLFVTLEITGFFVVFTVMILMRFTA
jgi:putative copper export protein